MGVQGHGVVVSGWESQSSCLSKDSEFGGKHCCNLSDHNHATFPLDGPELYRNFGFIKQLQSCFPSSSMLLIKMIVPLIRMA